MRRISLVCLLGIGLANLPIRAVAQDATGSQVGTERPVFGGKPSGFRPPPSWSGRGLDRSGGSGGLNVVLGNNRVESFYQLDRARTRPTAAAVDQARIRAMQQVRRQQFVRTNTTSTVRRSQAAHILTPTFVAPPINDPIRMAEIQRMETRLSDIVGKRGLGEIQIHLTGGDAVLTGTATDEASRRLLLRLLMLEPGIRSVEDRMTVAQAEESTE